MIERHAFQVYGVFTKAFRAGTADVHGSVGLNWTDINFGGMYSGSQNAFRPFASVNWAFPSHLNLAVDYQFRSSELESDALFSLVARYPLTPVLTGEVGFTNMNMDGMTGNSTAGFFAGVNYIFASER